MRAILIMLYTLQVSAVRPSTMAESWSGCPKYSFLVLPPVAKVWCSVTSSQKYFAAAPSEFVPGVQVQFQCPVELGDLSVPMDAGKNVLPLRPAGRRPPP